MTNAPQDVECSARDRPADEIEVTPAMIEAGVAVLWDWTGIADSYELSRKVYIAMVHAQYKEMARFQALTDHPRQECEK